MNTLRKETFFKVTAVIFLAVGVLHGARALNEWDLVLNSWIIPVWVSWAALALGLYLAYTAFKLQK